MGMFCYQCEQTMMGTGCFAVGECGKGATVASLQDLLLHAAKGISAHAHRARQLGASDREVDRFVVEALFATMTNVNFDPARLQSLIVRAMAVEHMADALYVSTCKQAGVEQSELGRMEIADTSIEALVKHGDVASIEKRKKALGNDLAGLQELVAAGVKGIAAYSYHAMVLGEEDDSVYAGIHEGLNLLTNPQPAAEELVGGALKLGELNLRVMGMLDKANTGAYGHPTPTVVSVAPKKGKAILVTGHDLKDLEELLKQTVGKGINVYTHGEMLPAHGYPGLKAYSHLAGNYGGAWQDQCKEFETFPGAILVTTNCIQQPRNSYKDRIFTAGPVAWPEVTHIAARDFSPVIEAALAAPGFDSDAPAEEITVGFGREAVLGVAGAVIDAVKSGAIRHFFLIGGCDGAKGGRNYYSDLAQAVPQDCVILTLACGKYRFNKLDFGNIAGIPRLLDIGQCNDAYSAIQIASALADAFDCGVNDLPLSLILSWYEQKAVAILLTLLHLGIKNIRLGPSLPAFITPAVLGILVKNYNIAPITPPEADLKAILG